MRTKAHAATLACVGLALAMSLLLGACAPPATPDGAAAETAHPGCPAPDGAQMPTPPPTPRDSPTAAAPVPTPEIGPYPTSAPDEPICLGPWRLVSPTAAPPGRFSVTDQAFRRSDGALQHLLIITDSQSGHTLQLGDREGDARLLTASDRYVIWLYYREASLQAVPRTSGLYVYDLQTDQEVVIGGRFGAAGTVHLSGDWITYIDNSQTGLTHAWGLRLHNLATAEDILLSQSVPIVPGYIPDRQHDVNEGQVAWADMDPATGRQVLKLFDLSTRQTRTLKIPVNIGPSRISVSASFVIWSDQALLGWDLATDRIFTIPYVPPTWEHPGPIPSFSILARDHHLEWHLTHAVFDAPFYAVDVIRK